MDFEKRIATLEGQNRRKDVLLLMLVAVCFTGVLLSAATQHGKGRVEKMNMIFLEDFKGRVRATFGVEKDGWVGLRILDKNRQVVGSVGATVDGEPEFAFGGGRGEPSTTTPRSLDLEKVRSTRTEVRTLCDVIGQYKLLRNRLPQELMQLTAPRNFMRGVKAGEVPNDPWGREYQYAIDPAVEFGFIVWSLGADPDDDRDDIRSDLLER